jgi:TolA-binding protein
MNISLKQWMSVMSLSLFVLAGCASNQATVAKAVTPTQKAFYEVQAFYEKGKYEKAMTAGQKFLDEHADHLFTEAIHYYMGTSAAKLGKQDEAKSHFETIVQHNPNGNWAQLAKLNLEEMGVSSTPSAPAAAEPQAPVQEASGASEATSATTDSSNPS